MSPSRKRVLAFIASHPNSEVTDLLVPLHLKRGAVKHHLLALTRSDDLDSEWSFCKLNGNRTFLRYSVKPRPEIERQVFPKIPHKILSLFI
jgi:predicted ArsR family transcriptional regulator